jgi:hypothetical protein
MKTLYLALLVITSVFLFSPTAYGQESEKESYIIFIKDFSAKDYYTLLELDDQTRLFSIDEACIPIGFLAISLDSQYNEFQSKKYTQAIVLKEINKTATFTNYSIMDLRKACGEFRDKHNNE